MPTLEAMLRTLCYRRPFDFLHLFSCYLTFAKFSNKISFCLRLKKIGENSPDSFLN
jgi:hypothetical protein